MASVVVLFRRLGRKDVPPEPPIPTDYASTMVWAQWRHAYGLDAEIPNADDDFALYGDGG